MGLEQISLQRFRVPAEALSRDQSIGLILSPQIPLGQRSCSRVKYGQRYSFNRPYMACTNRLMARHSKECAAQDIQDA